VTLDPAARSTVEGDSFSGRNFGWSMGCLSLKVSSADSNDSFS
jgi:hypothetical protein